MSLQDKIKKIINVIEESNINEIEISSFWGAQKIRLSKSISSKSRNLETKNKTTNEDDLNIDTVIQKESLDEIASVENSQAIEPDQITTSLKTDKDVPVEEDFDYQKAPLVGTFYLSSKPGEPPFVSVGDQIAKGQTLCIIEAMKIFNKIESDYDGTVVEILAEDSTPVEFNQPIFSIKPI